MSQRVRVILFWVLLFIIIFSGLSGFLITCSQITYGDLGERTIRVMYEFEDLNDLNEQYPQLESWVDESLWEKFSLNNDSRVISTYYKFQNLKSEVTIKNSTHRNVIYTLSNDYIKKDTRWVFDYVVKNGKIIDIREYEVRAYCYGTKGVW